MSNLLNDYQNQFFPSPSTRKYERYFECYSCAFVFRDDLEKGNKILLPASTLNALTQLDVSWPIIFQITNIASGLFTHCGVLEFSADEDKAYIPSWMMHNLMLKDGELVRITNVTLPKGTYVQIQPLLTEFFNYINDSKTVLEQCLVNFACLTEEDVIDVQYQGRSFEIEIIKCKPAGAILIIDADIEVDFALPKDYNVTDGKSAASSTTNTTKEVLPKSEWDKRIPHGVCVYNAEFNEIKALGKVHKSQITNITKPYISISKYSI